MQENADNEERILETVRLLEGSTSEKSPLKEGTKMRRQKGVS